MTRNETMGRRRRGSTMVELSMLLLVVLMMTIATLDFGQLLFLHQAMMERASEGARWAVVHSFNPNDTSNVKKMVVFNTVNPGANARGLFGLKPNMVAVTPLPSAANVQYIQVQIDYPMRFLTPGLAHAFSRSFRVVRRVESLGATT